MILDYSISVKSLTSFSKLQICFLVISFFTVTLNAQKDSLEVERLYKLGVENVRVKPQASTLNFENAIRIINDSILIKDEDNHYFLLKKALMLDDLGFSYRRSSDPVLSLKSIQESLKIKEDIGETYTLPTTYRVFGRLYFHKKDSVKTFQFYNKALVLSKQYQNDEEIVLSLDALSAYYMKYDDLETSRNYALEALKYADSTGFQRGQYATLALLGAYERHKKKYQAAIPYSKKGLAISTKNNDRVGMERSFRDLGYAYRKIGQPEKAVFYYKKSIEMVMTMEIEGLLANRLLSLSNAYTDLGEDKQAFAYYRGYKRQQIKDMNVKSIKEFAKLEAKYTYERQKTIDSIESVKKQKINESRLLEEASTKFWKITTIIATIFGLILTTIIFLYQRKKEQIKLGKLKNEMLQKEISYKQKDISDFALNISRNSKWREELLKYIKKIKKLSLVKNDVNFKALEKAVLDREIIDNTTIDFQNKVDVLNTAFYEKLHEEFPTLTKTEVKLCSFIRLNIDNNEIAVLQNVAVASVYRSRSRLRKKLNLSLEDNLNTFLSKF